MVAPEQFRDQCINGLRTSGWMATPIMAEVVYRLLKNCGIADQIEAKRKEAAIRNDTVSQVLADWLPPRSFDTPSFHRGFQCVGAVP
jgi:DNA-binding transcriptional MocR family regulator